jgi:hypothetical protein
MTTPTIDLAWAWTVITPVIAGVFGVLGKAALNVIQAHAKIAANSALMNDFSKLVALAGQFALDELSSVASHNMTVEVKSAAVANAINSAGAKLKATADALGYTPDAIASAVSGEVAKAMMPTATVAGTAPMPAVKS